LIPGRPPRRSGPSRTARPGVASGLGAEARRDLRRERMWRRLRDDRSRARLAFEFEPLRGVVSRAVSTVSRQRQARVGALLWAGPQGVRRFSAGQASWCLGVTCRGRAGSRRVSAVTAEAGRFGTFREVGSVRQVEALVRLWFQRRTSSAFRSPEGSHKCEGQAALPIAAGAWEARRATGYV